MMWLIYHPYAGWQVITTEELKQKIHDGATNQQIWRLIADGRQPECRWLDNYGLVRDIFGNVEVI